MAMTTSVLKVSRMANLPANPLSVAMSFLEPQEVAQAERVCTSWKRVIGSPDQRVWKGICARDNIQVAYRDVRLLKEDTVLGTHNAPSGGFTPQILGCIAEYAADYKDEAAVLRAHMNFYSGTWYLYDLSHFDPASTCHNYDWDNNGADEPFALVSYCTRTGSELPDAFPQLPENVPLRFFIDKTGSYKNKDDQVRLVFQGRRLILTCFHLKHGHEGRMITSLSEAAEGRVKLSLSRQLISDKSLKTAKTLAKAAPDWIVVKEKKKSE